MKSVSDLGPNIWVTSLDIVGSRSVDLCSRELTSLVGCPDLCDNTIYLNGNLLTSLVGAPKEINGDFEASHNSSLTSLVGGPSKVNGYYLVSACNLASLTGLPVKIGSFLCLRGNPMTSLQGINQVKEMHGAIFIEDCPITSHILGVFLIKGCQGIRVNSYGIIAEIAEIVNTHIYNGRSGLLSCTKELIEAGFADFAQV
jgi:hypothetical protein